MPPLFNPPGALVNFTDWVAYTPTFVGLGTVTAINVRSRRVGDSLEVMGYFTLGTVTGSTVTMTVGFNGVNSNVSIDTAKSGAGFVVGKGSTSTAPATTYFGDLATIVQTSSTVCFGVQTSGLSSLTPVSGTNLSGSGAAMSIFFTVPIVGWTATSSAGVTSSPTVQTFTSGSGTYTTPTGCKYIRVKMVGGGSGGAGSGTTPTTGGNGGNTTFGTTLLVANGGVFGNPGTPGTASLGTGPIGTAITGAFGGGNQGNVASSQNMAGGVGGSTPFGGSGGGGSAGVAGQSASANSGSGGGGGGTTTNGTGAGQGGVSGGYVDAIINTPLTTYAYAVGAAGTAGAAGTNGLAGGAGGSGYIEVREYYS